MLVLLDQATPVPIRQFLREHQVETAFERGWHTLRNGDLLKAAEDAGFEAFLTPDRSIRYQQNLALRRIAIIVLSTPQWPVLQLHVSRIVDAVNSASPGSYSEVEIPPKSAA